MILLDLTLKDMFDLISQVQFMKLNSISVQLYFTCLTTSWLGGF